MFPKILTCYQNISESDIKKRKKKKKNPLHLFPNKDKPFYSLDLVFMNLRGYIAAHHLK